MWSSVLGPRGVELTGIADSTRGVVEASATRFGNLAERTQLCSTKSTEAFQVSPRSAAMDSIFTKHKTQNHKTQNTKRTNLAFHNEINDACPPREPCSIPAEQTQFFLDRIEGARARLHPQADITPFWRNGETN